MRKDEQRYQLAPTEEEGEGLNDHETLSETAGKRATPSPRQRTQLRIHYSIITVAYTLLIPLYLYLLLLTQNPIALDRLITTPNNAIFPSLRTANAVGYETRPWPVRLHDNPFAGKPRPELEAAWHTLFEKNNIRVTGEDLAFYNVTSLPIVGPAGEGPGGYVGQLGVFHELHCLKRIRHWIYRDHYLADAPAAVLVEEEAHVDHCVELLREASLCRADLTLSGFRWIQTGPEGKQRELTVEAKGNHVCVDWERLRKWNDARAVDAWEPGVLGGA
ncbi:oxidase ustYa family protein [Aspergillus brunneoviolaceus CBS 621.78]|uniref:Uncharacterized protein n=1 Tax=Aspergillus brunneoviolaceus CBS 621.78 TaxID=1450534 RepID=A0ACD1GFH1_9EURO|nr:hypothetical protein BO95DRAFT_440979 [Aspergillus brunneoviolaceus CBS 621.78]RAH47975.1 hypothetical protein BO95DRAFT_440979 [Aspergillus brunneoviolaceus CBS 621.78]